MTRHKIQQARQLNISTGNTQLNPISSQKLLGIHIDETLSWNQYIDYLCSIISSRISLLRQLFNYVPENVQKNVLSKLCSTFDRLWFKFLGIHKKMNIERINKLQKRAARIILKVDLISGNVPKAKMDDSIQTNQL